MKVFAYCAYSMRGSVKKAAGTIPMTCPPIVAAEFDPAWLKVQDFIYFKLHGLPGQPYWYGDQMITALSVEKLRQTRLEGAIVFASNCYLPESPMLEALLDAGASAVIGGSEENYGGYSRLLGSDFLGKYIRLALQFGMSIQSAFTMAKALLHMHLKTQGISDALAFEMFTKGSV